MTDRRDQKSKTSRILNEVALYYGEKVMTHGATARGVDWNSSESQELRFEQLLKICDVTKEFSVNDYGCGYGALVEYINERGYKFKYCGFDISERMIAKAEELHKGLRDCRFVKGESDLSKADYTIASGIFNVKLETYNEEWEQYVLKILEKISEVSEKGFAFNMLSSYSDRERMRPDLYYANPLFIFDYCKKKFSRFVALLHDYPLYEFTLLVRRK